MSRLDIQSRLIVALDVPDRTRALGCIEQLSGLVGMFKVGLQLFTAEGPSLVREIIAAGQRVFLDLKLHDIPNTVAGAAASAANLGVSIFNVHALGGSEMMQSAASAARSTGDRRPTILAVTVLTSMDDRALKEVGIGCGANEAAVWLAELANKSGMDGVVASPREIRLIRERIPENFIILTPGIRPRGSDIGDQKRTATPAEAIRDGADYIVLGRAVTADPEPRAAVMRILDDLA